MATTSKPQGEKVKKPPVPVTEQVKDRLTRAVLSKKVTREELQEVADHVAKLTALA